MWKCRLELRESEISGALLCTWDSGLVEFFIEKVLGGVVSRSTLQQRTTMIRTVWLDFFDHRQEIKIFFAFPIRVFSCVRNLRSCQLVIVGLKKKARFVDTPGFMSNGNVKNL